MKCYYLLLIRLHCWYCCTYVFDCLSFCRFAQPWTRDIRLLPFFAVSKVQRATMVLTFCLAGDTKATVSFPPSPWNTLFLWRKWAFGLTKWFRMKNLRPHTLGLTTLCPQKSMFANPFTTDSEHLHLMDSRSCQGCFRLVLPTISLSKIEETPSPACPPAQGR